MTTNGTTGRLHANLTLGAVELTVASLDRSLDYYARSSGRQVLDHEAGSACGPARPRQPVQPRRGEPAPEDTAHLVGVDLLLPAAKDVRALAERLAAAAYPHALSVEGLEARDPSGNLLRFKANAI
ncbi:hypothetical protein AB0F15_23330 [Amycolatopsis sp. NPDC026612]|uniref:hypothetical protein n=1 Tax=Amycolatopsis sp. NPDC026612 TaxID=3155466 RepID=UPI0033F64114